jgi:hypothetical protein
MTVAIEALRMISTKTNGLFLMLLLEVALTSSRGSCCL